MRKIFALLSFFLTILLSGCFEMIQESSINNDGSGVYSSSIDMSAMLTMLSSIGGDDREKFEKMDKDTSFSLQSLKDSVSGLSDKQKQLLNDATFKMVMNMKDEKFFMTFNFPYTQPSDIPLVYDILKKVKGKTISQQAASMLPDDGSAASQMNNGLGDENMAPDLDYFFDITTENGKLTRKVNAERYAKAKEDKDIAGLKDLGQMGTPVTSKIVFNLPRPATKAEGKGVTLSDDKMKVTIEATIDEFFDDPSKFEYVIEY